EIEKNLGEDGLHFFDCLKYLLKMGRLEILPVKFNEVNLAHCKSMILFDGEDYIITDGSINFTLSALLKNSESFQVEAPWNGSISEQRIEETKNNFERIITKNHPEYSYIDKDKIEVIINSIGRDKDIKDLLDDSLKIEENSYSTKVKKIIESKRNRLSIKMEEIKRLKKQPHFPKFNNRISEHREYQKEAYKEWINNNYSGVFAMATGTGKTITSLNCLLNQYKTDGFYRAIILVPSITLLNQWEEEVKAFNY